MTAESPPRLLVVNADDFGLSEGINRGILEAHQQGIVTSTSLMVRAQRARSGAEQARQYPSLSIGLHLDLEEWRFVDGRWEAVYERAPLGNAKLVEAEVSAQFAIFTELVGRAPTHVDSHQHAHRNEPLRSIVTSKAVRLGIPVRHFAAGVRYCGEFYGQDERGDTFPERVTPKFLAALVQSLGEGTTELCCHPAAEVDFDSTYSTERVKEMRALCDPRTRAAVESAGFTLVAFSSLAWRIQ